MHHSSGRSHGGQPHLQHPYGQHPTPQPYGAYSASLKPTVLSSGRLVDCSYTFEIGLLAEPAPPEGTHFVEVQHPDYRRATTVFIGATHGALHAQTDTIFGFSSALVEHVAQIAAFAADGSLIAYGWPRPVVNAGPTVETVIIRAPNLILHRSR